MAHREFPERLTVRQWLRYRRLLGDLVRTDRRRRTQLTRARVDELKAQARQAARFGR